MSQQMKPELISFKLCPFVQRSVITSLEKDVDLTVTYIDLADKPDWFLKISPLGRVPVLKVNDSVLFESAVINEYLDEVNPPSLHPKDPLKKAQNRSWIEYGSNLLMLNYQLSVVKEESEYNQKIEEIKKSLLNLENQLDQSTYFNDEDFSLVDTSYAPFFMRLALNNKIKENGILNDFPKLRKYSENLLAKESVKKSVVEDFEELYIEFLKKLDSFIVK